MAVGLKEGHRRAERDIVGLTEDEVKRSRELNGDNSLSKEKKKGFFKRFLENLSDPIIKILLIALVLEVIFTLGHCNYFEIGGILLAVLISSTVSTASEYKSERAFEKLSEESLSGTVSVLRNGKIQKITVADIVVGDIIYLSVGEKIHADGKILSGKVGVDQSALNGEGEEAQKHPSSGDSWDLSEENKVFRGSLVTSGSGVMRVMRVGAETFFGMVARDVQSETRESPLKLRLARLASQISRIGYIVAALVGFAYLFNIFIVDNSFSAERIAAAFHDYKFMFSSLLHTLSLMITVVVVAAPEGLPMMITVVLSANMKRMLSDNILVKKLVGIETAGSMNILFTDKTGTLTEGKPKIERIVTSEGAYKTLSALSRTGEVYRALCLCARYNTDVEMISGSVIGGNGTDRAVFEYFSDADVEDARVSAKEAFTSENKYSSARVNGITLFKGAAEKIMLSSSMALSSSGDYIPFERSRLYSEYLSAVKRGERVLAVAISESGTFENLKFVALIVMKDKLRKGVKEAVKEVLGAGIQTVMITGDGRETATHIASECGIFKEGSFNIAIGSDELSAMTDKEIKSIIPNLRVIYRALPQDKTRLVRLSQELGLVVGMTGDGINDAPSLKLSDVGFAMGGGTDIAKSAADIVILDNSFTAIAKTILYGRTIFKSIRKFITFQLTMNFAACGISLFGQFIGIDTPITIIQMLWINIIMDTLGGLAFAGEPPLHYYMREKPKRRDEPILTKQMLLNICFSGMFTLGLCILFLTSYVFREIYYSAFGMIKFYTAFYALFVFMGVFNCFISRCERLFIFSGISKNRAFVFIMLLILAIQIFMIYFGGELFRCTPLSPRELLFVFLLAASVLPFDFIRRVFNKLK